MGSSALNFKNIEHICQNQRSRIMKSWETQFRHWPAFPRVFSDRPKWSAPKPRKHNKKNENWPASPFVFFAQQTLLLQDSGVVGSGPLTSKHLQNRPKESPPNPIKPQQQKTNNKFQIWPTFPPVFSVQQTSFLQDSGVRGLRGPRPQTFKEQAKRISSKPQEHKRNQNF